jgi:hypothetical protein
MGTPPRVGGFAAATRRAVTVGPPREIAALQRADIRYWSPIIDELREMSSTGRLIPEGTRI